MKKPLKEQLKRIGAGHLLKEQALFPVRIDMQVDFINDKSDETKFVEDVEKAIQGVIDKSGVDVSWTVNDYSMDLEDKTDELKI